MDWGSTWDFLWHFLIIFAWIAYLLVLFQILTDLFWRDHKTSGLVKAVWVIFLIVFPWLTAVIYLIARGKGMTERAREAAAAAKKETDDYIKQAAGRSPAQEIADAKALLESGTITPGRVRLAKGQGAQPISRKALSSRSTRPAASCAPGSGAMVRLLNTKPLSNLLSSSIRSGAGVKPAASKMSVADFTAAA